MTRFIRYLRQNQITVLLILSVIAFSIFMIKTLNKNISQEVNGSENIANTLNEPTNQDGDTENTITQSQINKQKINLVMNKFIKYCNGGDYILAYNLLSDDCKQNRYSTAEFFNTSYVKTVFSNYLNYTMTLEKQGENSYTYKIVFKTDAMATGSSKVISKNTYYTFILDETNNFKINIE